MERTARLAGAFSALGPLAFLLALALHGEAPAADAASWPLHVAAGSAVALTAGGLLLGVHRLLGRLVATAGLLGWSTQAILPLTESPALALLAIITVGSLLVLLWDGESRSHPPRLPLRSQPDDRPAARARMASIVTLATWVLVILGHLRTGGRDEAMLSLSVVLCLAFVAHWGLKLRQDRPVFTGAMALATLVYLVALLPLTWGSWRALVAWSVPIPLAGALLCRPRARRAPSGHRRGWDFLFGNTATLLVSTFLGLSVLGAAILTLPVASATGVSVGLLDAAFTSTSAVCVTGLIVLDTPNDFSFLGQAVILVLLQLGGLGIMSFSTAALATLGRRLSLRQEATMAELLSGKDRAELFVSLRRLLGVTFTAELAGAIVLSLAFLLEGDGALQALWRGVFTSVSAFCNAGFALQTDSLVPYRSSPWILHTVSTLIIFGGLSPALVTMIPSLIRNPRRLELQAKIVFSVTAVLLAAGAVLIAAIEWSNTLAPDASALDRLSNAWFQSVTLRTAGFNSVDTAAVRPATISVMLVMMFIGGSPGGTAGGIKTTTALVLLLAVRGALRGRWEAAAFGRRIAHRTVYRAASVTTLGMMIVLAGLIVIQLTQDMPPEVALFEVMSAFGTVGLSLGGTGLLDAVGKIAIIGIMLAGRVGPLSLFLVLTDRRADVPWTLPVEDLDTA